MLVFALALAGCASDPQPVPDAVKSAPDAAEVPNAEPIATPPPSVGRAEARPGPRQAWADDMMATYLKNNGANSFKAWGEGSPQDNIKSWSSPGKGVLKIVVANADYPEYELGVLPSSFMYTVGCAAADVDKVIVETVDKKHREVETGCG